jgi:hypothetical protein
MTASIASSTLWGMASNTPEKVRENRLRRMAERQGLRLEKSRRRDPRAIDYGRYMLVNAELNAAVAGTTATGRHEFTLDDVEAWLTSDGAAE